MVLPLTALYNDIVTSSRFKGNSEVGATMVGGYDRRMVGSGNLLRERGLVEMVLGAGQLFLSAEGM